MLVTQRRFHLTAGPVANRSALPTRGSRHNTLYALLVLGLGACGAEEEHPCATIKCGECPAAVEVRYTDKSTGKDIGWYESVVGLKIVGEDGSCNNAGWCYVYAKDESPDTVYEFDILYMDGLIDSYVTTAEVEIPGECCNCGYATRVIEVEVDGSKFHR